MEHNIFNICTDIAFIAVYSFHMQRPEWSQSLHKFGPLLA